MGLGGALCGLAAPVLSGCAAPASVVVTGGVDAERTAAYRALAVTAIPVVEDLWGTKSVPLPVRVELPPTLAAWSAATGHMPEQRGYAASTVRRAAAVERVETSVNPTGKPASDNGTDDARIVMYPNAWTELNAEGRLAVIVHEVTHLAMGTASGAPWWLGEGAAEYTAHRASSRSLKQIAGSAWEPAVRAPPTSWPNRDPQQPWQGYASAWLACVFVAETEGEESLVTLYESASAGRSLDEACRNTLGRGEAELLHGWIRWLSAQ